MAVLGELPSLDDRQREVLRLRFAEGLSQSAIAERIGCSQMQVSRILRSTLARAAGADRGRPEAPARPVEPPSLKIT